MSDYKPTATEIKELVSSISHIQNVFLTIGEKTGDTMLAFQNNHMLEMFKNVLFLAWEKYDYGWHSDFWSEGDSMADYLMFEIQAKDIIKELIKVLEWQSPFNSLETDGAITKGLLPIYNALLTKLEDEVVES